MKLLLVKGHNYEHDAEIIITKMKNLFMWWWNYYENKMKLLLDEIFSHKIDEINMKLLLVKWWNCYS